MRYGIFALMLQASLSPALYAQQDGPGRLALEDVPAFSIGSLADEIGSGELFVNGGKVEGDACVFRDVVDGAEHRIEFDYLGTIVEPLLRFTLPDEFSVIPDTASFTLRVAADQKEKKLAWKTLCADEEALKGSEKRLNFIGGSSIEVLLSAVCAITDRKEEERTMAFKCSLPGR